MYVEDKISHRGPFPLEVTETQTVAELKKQVEKEFEIPVNVQRWILGKELATDDNATLKDHNITTERCPVFLYLVAPGKNKRPVFVIYQLFVSDSKSNTESKNIKNPEIPSTSKLQMTDIIEEFNRIPKIVDVIPKIIEPAVKTEADDLKPVIKTEIKVEVLDNQIKNLKVGENKTDKVEEKKLGASLALPEEDLDDYDSKTLKPEAKEWECHLCTLLNPISSNICAVCATVRRKDILKKSVKKRAPQPNTSTADVKDETYLQLVNLDNKDVVENREPFECVVCFMEINPGEGVTLRECLHQFCKKCLAHTIEYTEDAAVKCPYRDEQYSCDIALQDREVKALVSPQVYEHYLAKSVAEAENKIGKSFHCKTPDCKGWCIFEDNVNEFRCPVCKKMNCLTCQVSSR